jgi:hypothetical protein
MISDARSLVSSVLTACVVDPPGGFQWFGRRIRAAERAAGEEEAHSTFLRTLALHLYLQVFCPGEATARPFPTRASGAGEIRALLAAHSSANPDRDRWDSGWTYVGKSRDSYLVRRQGLDFSVSAKGIRTRPGDALREGCDVQVLVPAERWSRSPGYMLFYGARLLQPRSAGIRRTRLYLHMDAEGARRVIGLCRRFNDARLPFTLKVAGHPDAYDRCDTVILFVQRDDYRLASEILVEEATGSDLRTREAIPAFTRKLAAGVSVSDDPHAAESFGESRCRLLATAIVRAHEAGARTVESRLREIEGAFLEEGLTLDHPHLEPGSEDYEIGPWAHWPIRDDQPT